MREIVYAIDIETVSQGKVAKDYTDNQSYALGNVKDPVKIEAKLKEKKGEAAKKHGLSWWLGKVCSVAIIDLHSDSNCVMYGYDEKEVLQQLSDYINSGPVKLIGKNSQTFDFPFLIGRYMANGLPIPGVLKKRGSCLDVENFFGYSSASGQRSKLCNYAHGLGIGEKTLHGSMVQELYSTAVMAKMEGKKKEEKATWKSITDYNLQDSQIVKEMALKYYGPEIGDIYGS